jgi:hypothetical protein
MGSYYDSPFLEAERLSVQRVDPIINFTWGLGRLTETGTDFVTVRWEGTESPVERRACSV